MGKGDRKSRRGKLFKGTFGVRRPRKKTETHTVTSQPKPAVLIKKKGQK